ncbi:MAG: hypothetical protein JKP98_06935 [Rhodobacteraceae bacterium]|nr:hypothetical protein [Paracoccaceae bacterium]
MAAIRPRIAAQDEFDGRFVIAERRNIRPRPLISEAEEGRKAIAEKEVVLLHPQRRADGGFIRIGRQKRVGRLEPLLFEEDFRPQGQSERHVGGGEKTPGQAPVETRADILHTNIRLSIWAKDAKPKTESPLAE